MNEPPLAEIADRVHVPPWRKSNSRTRVARDPMRPVQQWLPDRAGSRSSVREEARVDRDAVADLDVASRRRLCHLPATRVADDRYVGESPRRCAGPSQDPQAATRRRLPAPVRCRSRAHSDVRVPDTGEPSFHSPEGQTRTREGCAASCETTGATAISTGRHLRPERAFARHEPDM